MSDVPTVLLTGAAGTLGRALTPVLLERGETVRSLDLATTEPLPGASVEFIQADLREREVLRRVVEGVDAIVHAAAWHGIHLRDHAPADFWELNVDATFHLYEAAEAAGVRRIVLASTMGVYGNSRGPHPDGRAVRIHEQLPLQPVNVYELSKATAEAIGASYGRHPSAMRTVVLRFGMFVPEPFLHAGIRFLYGGVDERDVAAAVVAALDRTASEDMSFESFNVMSALPYDDSDAIALRDDPMVVIGRHWPDAPGLMAAAGVEPWGPINEWYDITAAQRALGWRPRLGFAEFLHALREGRSTL